MATGQQGWGRQGSKGTGISHTENPGDKGSKGDGSDGEEFGANRGRCPGVIETTGESETDSPFVTVTDFAALPLAWREVRQKLLPLDITTLATETRRPHMSPPHHTSEDDTECTEDEDHPSIHRRNTFSYYPC